MSVLLSIAGVAMTYDHDEAFARWLESQRTRPEALEERYIRDRDLRFAHQPERWVCALAPTRRQGWHTAHLPPSHPFRLPTILDKTSREKPRSSAPFCCPPCLPCARHVGPSARSPSGQVITFIPQPR